MLIMRVLHTKRNVWLFPKATIIIYTAIAIKMELLTIIFYHVIIITNTKNFSIDAALRTNFYSGI